MTTLITRSCRPLLLVATLLSIVPASLQAAPTRVTVAGSLQSELGCAGDWDPACERTELFDGNSDGVWTRSLFGLPDGAYEYKVAIDRSWVENYGANASPNGANIGLNFSTGGVGTGSVRFYYDEVSHWATDDVNDRIVAAVGSFQSELGCAGDWDPGCLRSWLQDIDRDGTYTFVTSLLPVGSYETKAALDEAWFENYGSGGVPNGANIAFAVTAPTDTVLFSFVSSTNVLTVDVRHANGQGGGTVPLPGTAALLALGLLGLLHPRIRGGRAR